MIRHVDDDVDVAPKLDATALVGIVCNMAASVALATELCRSSPPGPV